MKKIALLILVIIFTPLLYLFLLLDMLSFKAMTLIGLFIAKMCAVAGYREGYERLVKVFLRHMDITDAT